MDKNLADGTHTRNVGTVGTGVTAQEYGDGQNHYTKLTLSGVPVTIGDNAALAVGALVYTLPAGAGRLNTISASVGLTLTTGTPTTDTPDFGVGTVLASGANALLSAAPAGSEDILTGQTMTDIAGTATTVSADIDTVFEVAGARTVHVNFADTWADVTDTAATADGTIWLWWSLFA